MSMPVAAAQEACVEPPHGTHRHHRPRRRTSRRRCRAGKPAQVARAHEQCCEPTNRLCLDTAGLAGADSCALPDVCLQLNGFWTCTAGFYHAACRIQVIAGPLQVIRRIIEGGLAGAASRAGRRPRMIWKTTTSVGLRHMPDEAEMLNIYSPVGLALFDMKGPGRHRRPGEPLGGEPACGAQHTH